VGELRKILDFHYFSFGSMLKLVPMGLRPGHPWTFPLPKESPY